jgi:hypothetical protein
MKAGSRSFLAVALLLGLAAASGSALAKDDPHDSPITLYLRKI